MDAISNTDRERIYSWELGTLSILGRVAFEPTMEYFSQKHHRSLNPGGPLGLGKFDPRWVIDMTIADIQAILTIAAEVGWVDVTPDDQVVEPRILPVLALIKAVQIVTTQAPMRRVELPLGLG